jgi:hypothetical protein
MTFGGIVDSDNEEDAFRRYLASAGRGAGIGGTFGSFLGPKGSAIGAIIGGLGGLGYEALGRPLSRDRSPELNLQDFFGGAGVPQSESDWLMANRGLFVDGGGPPEDIYSGAAGGLNAAESAAINDYWRTLQQYGGNRAAALRNMFSGMAAAQARSGAMTERGGQQLAADIESLYSQLGADVAGLSADAMAGGPTGGLAPVSGAAATAPVELQATGGNLADFLERSTGAQVQNMYDLAGIQGLQGAAMSQNFVDMLAMAEQQARADARIRAAQRSAAAGQQAAAARAAWQQQQREQERAFNQELALSRRRDSLGMTPERFADALIATGDSAAVRRQIERLQNAGFSQNEIAQFLRQNQATGQ